MTYEWQWYERDTGQLHVLIEKGEPCECVGRELPHPPRLCAAIRARNHADLREIGADSRENARVTIDDVR